MTPNMGKLALYDTATREISEFKPLAAGKVSIYVCGATVQQHHTSAMFEAVLTLIFCAAG
jgi:cysteinyl-tRNA synthetase